jgi:hypothetical protein
MLNIQWFFAHSALIGAFIATMIAIIFTILRTNEIKKFDYFVVAISILVSIATHNVA